MPLLPPRDDAYRGSVLAIAFLWLQVALNAFRGFVHVFWPDSGAGSIAGIDLAQNGAPVKQVAAAWLLWVWKPLGVEAPGKLGALAGVPLVALALWLSLRERAPAPRR